MSVYPVRWLLVAGVILACSWAVAHAPQSVVLWIVMILLSMILVACVHLLEVGER